MDIEPKNRWKDEKVNVSWTRIDEDTFLLGKINPQRNVFKSEITVFIQCYWKHQFFLSGII